MKRSFIALVIALAGCPDPVREDLEDAQGPEAEGVPPGEKHRPGQPCLVCHRDGGEGPEFSFGGTVYLREGALEPADRVKIVVRDSNENEQTLYSNDVGNFWMPASEWKPVFPLRVELRDGANKQQMLTEIPREGSCNKCHHGDGSNTHMPRIYVLKAPK